MRRRKPWGPPHKPFGRPKAHPRRHRFTKPRACAQYLVPPEEERPEVCEKVQASLLCVRVEHATTNQRPSPWQASAGTSHGRLGRTMEDQQGQNSGSYMPRSPLPSSAQDHPGHPEPSSLLTEFVDGFEGPPSPASGLLSVRATAEYLGVSLTTVYSLVATRQLPCVRVSNAIRIRPADLAAYLALRGE